MKITKPFVVIVTLICMSFMYAAMAQRPPQPGPSVSPRPNLTGATYCLFGQGTWLFADPVLDVVGVTVNPFAARLDFTSSMELTITRIYDPITGIQFPPAAIGDSDDLGNPAMGTYTLVGNLLTITADSETTSFIMTPNAEVFVGGFALRGDDGGTNQSWKTGMIIGVRAANCDLPVLSNQ